MSSISMDFADNGADIYGPSGDGTCGAVDLSHVYGMLHMRAVLGRCLAWITGRRVTLRDLNEDTSDCRICGQRHIGVTTVGLDRIIGSEGRSEDFDRQFRPLQTHTRARWYSIARAREQNVPLPAVDLIQVGDAYYVRDGNHRVSVVKSRGQISIDANVTELLVAPRTAQEVPELTSGLATGLTAADAV